MKQRFIDKTFSGSSLRVIHQANDIISDYLSQGYKLTLRQLYYQFVSRGLIPNKQSEYKRLGSIIGDARLAGLLDWDAIEDRGRNVRSLSFWSSPAQILRAVADQYRIDRWENQPCRVECWIEKEALAGVIEGICRSLRIDFLACKGYMSLSEMYEAATARFIRYGSVGQKVVLLHLGDHDPSGIDMTRDIRDRLEIFGAIVKVKRLALNKNQIDRYNPPPNPAKLSDSRAENYIERYGTESWELDALPPDVLVNLIRTAVEEIRDDTLWDETGEQETEERDKLGRLSSRWKDVCSYLDNK